MPGSQSFDDNFLREMNARQVWHPMAHPADSQANLPVILTSGQGVRVTDIDGHETVDAVGGLWNVNLGYSCEPVKKAIAEQLAELPYANIFRGVSNDKVIQLAHETVDFFATDGMARAFFTSGGSDSVETALRLARQYHKVNGEPSRTKFLSLKKGYHGTHFGGASVNGNANFRTQYEPLLAGCFHIPAPYTYRNPFSETDPEALAAKCVAALVDEINFQGAGTIAAFIMEPILGAGGVIPPHASFMPAVREVCDRHGILLIADEVITGFGRTGQWFASQTMELEPDMMALAKGLTSGYVPMSAVMVGDRVANKLVADGGEFYHGFTYSGHPVAAAVALANLELIEREDMITRVREDTGPYLAEALAPLAEHRIVGEIRTFGVLAAIELVKSKDGPEMFEDTGATGVICRDHAINRGLMMRAVRDAMILSPALTYTRADIDETIRIAGQALDATADQLGL